MENNLRPQEGTVKATGWLIATFIFALLGGWLGIVFGVYVWRKKDYLPTHRKLGLIGAILSCVSLVVWKAVMA